METLPSFLLKEELPCGGHETNERLRSFFIVHFNFAYRKTRYWLPTPCLFSTGESSLCAINRSSIYILLAININLATLCCELYTTTFMKKAHKNNIVSNFFSTCVPIFLLVVAYMVEDHFNINSTNNELNLARHAFSCSMRCAFLYIFLYMISRLTFSPVIFLSLYLNFHVAFFYVIDFPT